MKLNNAKKPFSLVGNWIATTLFSLMAIALVWQSSFFLDNSAKAAPSTLVATTGSEQAQNAADKVRDRSKDLIRDTKRNVEKTANKNAAKVDQADDEGSFVERKARRDQARIGQRAEEDAARTEKAVDKSVNTFKGAVENIKDAFKS